MAQKLTKRQQEVLALIEESIRTSGFPPTRAEIARALGFRSANAAEDHLRALARKGVITLIPGASRGIQLNEALHTFAPQAAKNSGLITLPLIGRVAAGNPILAAAHIENEIPVQPSLFTRTPDFLLRVQGESMRDAGILDGDLLAVKKAPEAHHGQIIVARIGDDVTVKRLYQQNNQLQLLSENPDFSPIVITASDTFAIEGLAVGLIRTQTL